MTGVADLNQLSGTNLRMIRATKIELNLIVKMIIITTIIPSINLPSICGFVNLLFYLLQHEHLVGRDVTHRLTLNSCSNTQYSHSARIRVTPQDVTRHQQTTRHFQFFIIYMCYIFTHFIQINVCVCVCVCIYIYIYIYIYIVMLIHATLQLIFS